MTKKKKIVIGVFASIAAVILAFVLLIFWAFYGDGIKLRFNTAVHTPAAKAAAKEYIEEKYGEKAVFSESKPITYSPEIMFAPSIFAGISFQADGYEVRVYYNDHDLAAELADGECFICDNRQYDDICTAFEEKYLNDTILGASYKLNGLSLDFNECSGYKDALSFTSGYFDGDIEKLLRGSDAKISASVTYEGYTEKRGEYRKLLNDKLYEIYDIMGQNASVFIYIHDPALSLPEMPYKAVDKARIQAEPRYEDYMELIAYGYTANPSEFDKYPHVFMTEWYEIDEYTSISDDLNPIRWEADFVFRQVDMSDNTVAYRGRYKHDDRADKNILTVRDNGYRVHFNDSRRLDNIFLRLDREHYNITDKTIPLITADWDGKRFYLTVGYGNGENTVVDTNYEDWYYLDDEFLYLYINSLHSDFFGYTDEWILTFSDSEMPV